MSKFNADINSAGDGWIQVTISGDTANTLTEAQIASSLSTLPIAGEGPEGWQLVPTVATLEMEHAAVARVKPFHDEDWYRIMPKDLFRLAWKALLNAAPTPPSSPGKDGGQEVEAVGEAGEMPGSNGGFTMAAFKASNVPIGTKLYTRPQPASTALVERLTKALANLVIESGGKAIPNSSLIAAREYAITVLAEYDLNVLAEAALSASTSREGER